MAMPRGRKVDCGYATVADGGGDYRMIAEVMTSRGFKMNHSSARNGFLSAMRGLAESVLMSRGEPAGEDEVMALARKPMFQEAVRDMYENAMTVGAMA